MLLQTVLTSADSYSVGISFRSVVSTEAPTLGGNAVQQKFLCAGFDGENLRFEVPWVLVRELPAKLVRIEANCR